MLNVDGVMTFNNNRPSAFREVILFLENGNLQRLVNENLNHDNSTDLPTNPQNVPKPIKT